MSSQAHSTGEYLYIVIKEIRTRLRTYIAYISVKYHLYKNVLRLTWKNTGSYSAGFYSITKAVVDHGLQVSGEPAIERWTCFSL